MGRCVGPIRNRLLTPKYLEQLVLMNDVGIWGRGGYKYADEICALADDVKAKTILDYGCGQGTLARDERMGRFRMFEYDPGILGKDEMPFPADVVVVTDVMEHIEPRCLDAVIRHIHSLTKSVCYAVISTRPATKVLPNHQNAHLIVQDGHWWQRRFRARWTRVAERYVVPGEVRLEARMA